MPGLQKNAVNGLVWVCLLLMSGFKGCKSLDEVDFGLLLVKFQLLSQLCLHLTGKIYVLGGLVLEYIKAVGIWDLLMCSGQPRCAPCLYLTFREVQSSAFQ